MKLIPIEGKANGNLYRHPDTGIIYVSMSKKGKGRLERSTKTANLNEARTIASELVYKFLGRRNPVSGRKLNKESFDEFLQTKEIKSPRTYQRIRLSIDHLRTMLDEFGPEDITEQWWEGVYIPAKRAHQPKRKFFNDRKTLRMYLLFLQRQGLLERMPELVNPDAKRDAGKVFTDKEIKDLLKHANEDLHLQILMAFTMGMRKSEILLLSCDRVDTKRKLITLRPEDTKTRKGRVFAVSQAVWPLLKPRLENVAGFVFPSSTGEARPVYSNGNQTAWDSCRRNAKVSGRFHDLRHTFLTRAFKAKGANAALICHYAGLSLEEAERTYLHLTPEDTRGVAGLVSMREK